MTRFSFAEAVPFPRERVFTFQRDNLGELVPRLKAVSAIETLERTEDGPRVHSVKRWTGSTDGVPAAVRDALPLEAFQWRDTSIWDASGWIVRWSHRHERWPDAMRATGTNRFEDDFGETRVLLEGEIALSPERVPGVLEVVGAALGPLIERVVVAQIRASLRETLALIAERLEDG
jgi:hypothetical protein